MTSDYTTARPIQDALGEVYSGAGPLEVGALIDQLSDRGLAIVKMDAIARAASPFMDLDTALGRVWVRRSDVIMVEPSGQLPRAQCLVYLATMPPAPIKVLTSAAEVMRRVEGAVPIDPYAGIDEDREVAP